MSNTKDNLYHKLAKRFPGLLFPDKAAIRPGELIGFLSQELVGLEKVAERALPKKKEEGDKH